MTTTTTPTIHIDDTSLRLALVRHLSAALSCLAIDDKFMGEANVKVMIEGEELFSTISAVTIGSSDDFDCAVVLELWVGSKVIGGLSAKFTDYGTTIVPGELSYVEV